METRFRAPVPLATDLLVRGWISATRSRQAQTQATVALAETGQVLAEASAKFILRRE
jgi:acyl-CoA thioesterase FadM